MFFKQTDEKWGAKTLGESTLTMRNYGCIITSIAQAMYNKGYEKIDPGMVVDALNKIKGFTDKNHNSGAGLVIWAKVQEAFPQFQYGQGGVEFVKGHWGKLTHWVLVQDGVTIDPFYGVDQAPKGFVPTGVKRTAVIIPNSDKDVSRETISKSEEKRKESQKSGFKYMVVKGDTLGKIVEKHYGNKIDKPLWGKGGKVEEVANHNNLENPDHIVPGQKIILL